MMKKTRSGLVLLAFVCIAGLTGCYTRTVEAKGLGAEWGNTELYEPNLKESGKDEGLLDDAGDVLFGGRKIEERKK